MMFSRCIYREENSDSHLEIWEDGETRSLWFDDVILPEPLKASFFAVLSMVSEAFWQCAC